MDNEKDFLLSNLINSLVKDEWTAVNAYESAIATLTDTGNLDVIAILEDIRDEEYVHIGQLESCLSLLKGDPTEHIEDGSEEGFEQLELPEEDDEEDDIELKDEPLTEDELPRKEHTIKDMDVDEIKTRLKAVGFDDTDFMGKSDKEIRAMLKISRRARGDDYLRKWNKERREKEKSTKLSEKEMKKIICDMVTKYDASEEEVFDELQAQDPKVTKDIAHRLFKMCNKSSVPESVKEDFDFDKTWGDLNNMED